MKKTILRLVAVLFFFLSSYICKAQDSLVFNRVVLYNIAINDTSAISVPAGKVWKIESVSMGASSVASGVFLKTGNQKIAYFSSPVNAYSANFPYWLPASFTGSFVNNNTLYRCSISIIEYNMP